MANKGKERENFFRINVLVVDHIKNALVDMFKHYLRHQPGNKEISFDKFIGQHIKDIKYLRRSKILYQHEVDKLIVGDKAISGIKVDNLELTLVRRLLDNLCQDLFMDDGCQTLQDFLKKNRHDIYHLFKCDQRCCQCKDHYKFPVREQLLKENEYKTMFESSPCTNCTGTREAVCSYVPCKDTEYIRLDYGTRCTVFEHFSRIFKAVQKLKKIRDNAYGHIEAGVIRNELYDDYYKETEENIMVLARFCGNEDQTRLALDDVQKRSCDETLCIQYKIRLTEQVKRDNELMEGIGENRQILQEHSQILQKIPQQLQELKEQMGNLKATETKLTKDVGVTVDVQTLQETKLLISTPSSGNQSSTIAISAKKQMNLYSQTQQHQLDDRSLEHQNLQTLNNDIPSTSTQPPILGIQNLMNQTNNIERNNLSRDQGQKDAVVTSGALMWNLGPQNFCSQDYPSIIENDSEPYISSVNNERVHDLENKTVTAGNPHKQNSRFCKEICEDNFRFWWRRVHEDASQDIYDGVVLHAEDDRDAAIEFITNMERENPDLKINITLYESLFPGKPIFQSVAEIFDICRCLFVFVTQNFVEADLEVFLASIATLKIITSKEENDRLITVKASRNCNHHLLDQFLPLKYYHYLEAKKTQRRPDRFFIKSFTQVITDRRQKYLK